MKIQNKDGKSITIYNYDYYIKPKSVKDRLSSMDKAMEDADIIMNRPKRQHHQKKPIVDNDGSKFWVDKNDNLKSRLFPSVILSSGVKYWVIKDALYTFKALIHFLLITKIKQFKLNFIKKIIIIFPSSYLCKFFEIDVQFFNERRELHKLNGPARLSKDGTKEWYINGVLHRTDGPAVVKSNGVKEWYRSGVLHRENGPAITYPKGDYKWYKNGKLHREDGPAKLTKKVLRKNPSTITGVLERYSWFIEGKLHRENEPAVINFDGTKKWFNHGNLHRVGKPAVEYPNGGYEHYNNGALHRDNGPAFENESIILWAVKGRLHREGGPAIELKKDITNSSFMISRIRDLFRSQHLFVFEGKSGDKFWFKDGKLHNLDGPAIEFADGTKKWLAKGKLHKEDGPAVEYPEGSKEWWVKGSLHREGEPAVVTSPNCFIYNNVRGNVSKITTYYANDKQYKYNIGQRVLAREIPIEDINKTKEYIVSTWQGKEKVEQVNKINIYNKSGVHSGLEWWQKGQLIKEEKID